MKLYEILENGDLMVSWDDVRYILRWDHRGTPEDDDYLVKTLLDLGAPDWIRGAEGYIDVDGWYLSFPRKD